MGLAEVLSWQGFLKILAAGLEVTCVLKYLRRGLPGNDRLDHADRRSGGHSYAGITQDLVQTIFLRDQLPPSVCR